MFSSTSRFLRKRKVTLAASVVASLIGSKGGVGVTVVAAVRIEICLLKNQTARNALEASFYHTLFRCRMISNHPANPEIPDADLITT